MRRILLGSGIALALLLMLAVLLVKVWGTSYAWDVASSKARDFGIELTREELSWSWNGGLGFSVRLRGVGARTLRPGALVFDLKIAAVDVTARFARAENLATIDELSVTGVSGAFSFEPEAATEKNAPATGEGAARIPDLRALEIEIPKPPVDVELRAYKLAAADLRAGAGKLGTAVLTAFESTGSLTWKKEAFTVVSVTALDAREIESSTAAAAVKAGALKANLKVGGRLVAPVGERLRVALTPDARVDLSGLRLDGAKVKGVRVDNLTAEARIDEAGPFFGVTGAGARGLPGVPGAVAFSAEVKPTLLSATEARIELKADAPGLLRAQGAFMLPRELARVANTVSGDFSFEARAGLFTLFVPGWPATLASSVTGNVKVKRVSAETAQLEARVSSSWLRLTANARVVTAGESIRDADAEGSLQVNLPATGVQWKDLRVGGGLRVPLKFLFRDGERFYVESSSEFRSFSYRQPGFAIEDVDGAFFISQSWAARQNRWRMAPVRAWNPFSRVDLASSESLDPEQKVLTAARITYGDRTAESQTGIVVGPLRMSAAFRQNQLFVPSWSLACPQGRFQGILLMDVRLDQPRVGLSFNAIEVDLSRVLPAAMTGGRKVATDPTSFVLNLDWDLAKAQAFGNFDWLQMTPGQVHTALDIFDPLGEKPAFNTTRSMLANAYPTRVRMNMKGALADVQVSTNLVEIPPITNVSIGPYLVKYREMLFDIPLVKSSRTPEAP